jgi:hypothetical protein
VLQAIIFMPGNMFPSWERVKCSSPLESLFLSTTELGGFCGIQVRPDTDKPDTFYRKKDVLSVCPVRPPL